MEFVEVERAGDAIATLTLNRPEKKNALSIAVRDEVTATLAELAADESVKVVILTGAGSVFCAGFDLAEFQRLDDPDHTARLWESSDRFHHACLTFPLPLVAAINGPALAGGFDLAVMCDVRIASERARFSHPEHTFGDVVYSPLHDIVGGGVARDLVLSGRPIDAAEALRWDSSRWLCRTTCSPARRVPTPARSRRRLGTPGPHQGQDRASGGHSPRRHPRPVTGPPSGVPLGWERIGTFPHLVIRLLFRHNGIGRQIPTEHGITLHRLRYSTVAPDGRSVSASGLVALPRVGR